MTTGERIRAARLRSGMTQRELAERLKISSAGIGQWENNVRNPKLSTLQKMAEVLNVNYQDLLGDDKKTPEPFVCVNLLDKEKADEILKELESVKSEAEANGSPFTDTQRDEWIINRVQKAMQDDPGLDLRTLFNRISERIGHTTSTSIDETDQLVQEIVEIIQTMNLDGRMAALHHVRELSKIPDYQKKKR